MKCPHCGQEHPDDTKFCPQTGKKVESQYFTCNNPECNFRQPLPLSAKFCPNCGTHLVEDNNVPYKNQGNELLALATIDLIYPRPVYIINPLGNIIKELEYEVDIDCYSFFSEGLARVILTATSKVGYINKNGDFVIPPIYEWGTHFSEGLALVCNGEHKKYINTAGETILEEFGNVKFKTEFINGIAIFEDAETSLQGYLNKQGDIILKPQFGSCEPFNNGIAQVRYIDSFNYYYIDNKGNFIDRKNQIQFHSSRYFDGFAIFSRRGKFGYIDTSMKIIIQPRFHEARPFSHGLAAVKENEDYFKFINHHGEVVIDKYDEIFPTKSTKIEEVSDFRNGLVVFGIKTEVVENRWGYIHTLYGVMNIDGEILCPPKYDGFITDFGF